MRIALARALYVKPHLLLLDEPTNHLDLDACVWLEEELSTYKRILVIISHSQDFLNGVCTNIIHLNKKRLKYYTVSTRLSIFNILNSAISILRFRTTFLGAQKNICFLVS